MRYNQIEKSILKLLNEPSLLDLKKLLDAEFIYVNEDRGYVAIDIENDDYSNKMQGQTFIFTAEEDNDEEEEGKVHLIVWDGSYGIKFEDNLIKALEYTQYIAMNIYEDYKSDYSFIVSKEEVHSKEHVHASVYLKS